MKKISSFIPVHLINKNDLIKDLTCYIYDVFPKNVLDNIEVSSVKEDVLIIACKNSSIATLMRFEKQQYIDLLRDNSFCEINDIRVTISD
ncbi:MAG: DUF721 domain-containing protein [Gammaproteobacteria bacterium]|jgi:hypothetical protein|nr:DUF721 domain-containing protein [Gammaproteobacteria bacterium]MBT4462742.1 DUF721 domain-containing protein [Gammaproteobacteria bacterium]MBT4654382.1 DUF721 domain-containing protein [Gammaproteobacteria bacterium]MBT5117297.1 DUF721 domain-containing protein [Gammaproteobacteria bacterium]MBT5761869.1 DUF721 domain-containing protein [Gammaproteobacteria bacterium]